MNIEIMTKIILTITLTIITICAITRRLPNKTKDKSNSDYRDLTSKPKLNNSKSSDYENGYQDCINDIKSLHRTYFLSFDSKVEEAVEFYDKLIEYIYGNDKERHTCKDCYYNTHCYKIKDDNSRCKYWRLK